MNRKLIPLSFLLAGLCVGISSQAASPHVHGAAKMQIAVDGNSMEVELVFPLDSLVGFERAPRNDKERQAIKDVMERLNEPKNLLVPAAAAQCTHGKTEIHAPALEPQPKDSHVHGKHPHGEEHAELEAVISYRCMTPALLNSMEIRLFETFPRVQRLKAEVAAPGKQSGAKLDRKNRTLSW